VKTLVLKGHEHCPLCRVVIDEVKATKDAALNLEDEENLPLL
jgi:hypothetical protein